MAREEEEEGESGVNIDDNNRPDGGGVSARPVASPPAFSVAAGTAVTSATPWVRRSLLFSDEGQEEEFYL